MVVLTASWLTVSGSIYDSQGRKTYTEVPVVQLTAWRTTR